MRRVALETSHDNHSHYENEFNKPSLVTARWMVKKEWLVRKRKLTIQFGFWQNGVRNTLFGQLRSLFRCGSAVNRAFFSLAAVDLPRFLGETRTYIFEVFLDVVMDSKQHLFELSR